MTESSYVITPKQIGGLAALTDQRFRYVQRCVEQLSFVPTGGQRWVRTLQIEIPLVQDSASPSWWVVSLGQFERKRLADLAVTGADGSRLDLLTRRQHGDVLAGAATAKYLLSLSRKQQRKLNKGSARKLNQELRELLFTYFTSLDSSKAKKGKSKLAATLASKYRAVLDAIEVDEGRRSELVASFLEEFEKEEGTTQYLCWAKARPGEVINLQATYTANDPKHELRLDTLGEAVQAVFRGLFRPRKGRKTRDDWYRQYGIAPVGYRSGFPRGAGAGSYYLTLTPPADTVCTLLDWETGSSFNEDREVNSAFTAVHIHNDEPTDPPEGHATKFAGELRAYLRCAPYRHKQILAATALNFMVVLLLARRQLPVGLKGPLQEFILAAPSIVIAFLAQRQSHYHAHVTRRQRAILWIYLAVSVTFLVSIAFDGQTKDHQLSGWTDFFAWALAISSAGVFGWHLLLGGSYERVVHYLTDRKWEVGHPAEELSWQRKWANRVRKRYWERKEITAETKWECFAFAVRQYAVTTWMISLALMAAAGFALHHFGHFPLKLVEASPSTKIEAMTTPSGTNTSTGAASARSQPLPKYPAPAGNRLEGGGR